MFLRKVKTDQPKPWVTRTEYDYSSSNFTVYGNFHDRSGSSYTQELASTYMNFRKPTYYWSNGTTTYGDWEVDGWGPDYLSWSLPSGYSGTTSTSAGWIHNSSPAKAILKHSIIIKVRKDKINVYV